LLRVNKSNVRLTTPHQSSNFHFTIGLATTRFEDRLNIEKFLTVLSDELEGLDSHFRLEPLLMFGKTLL
jgi:hypothetical protein